MGGACRLHAAFEAGTGRRGIRLKAGTATTRRWGWLGQGEARTVAPLAAS